ncbi:hypothetical protein D3C80_1914190 [compost metagenome]
MSLKSYQLYWILSTFLLDEKPKAAEEQAMANAGRFQAAGDIDVEILSATRCDFEANA